MPRDVILDNLAEILPREIEDIKASSKSFKRMTQREHDALMLGLDFENERYKHFFRKCLSWILVGISISWLIFTAVFVCLVGTGVFVLSDGGVMTFILGSLAEVFGLWKISLTYFYMK